MPYNTSQIAFKICTQARAKRALYPESQCTTDLAVLVNPALLDNLVFLQLRNHLVGFSNQTIWTMEVSSCRPALDPVLMEINSNWFPSCIVDWLASW